MTNERAGKANKKVNQSFSIDKKTRRATFLANNQAALVHGGYSKNIPAELMNSVLAGDLGFEYGMLKGQLANIALLSDKAIQSFSSQGDDASALHVALACADSTSRLIPQIQKVLESKLSNNDQFDDRAIRLRSHWLKKLRAAGGCNALEVAYQFEVNELGSLPSYVQKQLENELRTVEPELVRELYSREELKQKLRDYWDETETESELMVKRKTAIDLEKQRINEEFFGEDNGKS
jgi:hypothetical protein